MGLHRGQGSMGGGSVMLHRGQSSICGVSIGLHRGQWWFHGAT